MMKNTDLAAFAIRQMEQGCKYWYGTCWYPCTETLLKSKARQYPSHYKDSRMSAYRAEIAESAYCCDCVGLIKGAAWSECGAHISKYATNGCSDLSASGMYKSCKKKGEIAALPEVIGLLLYKEGHVGVYVGGGYAIEARGFAYDVVKTAVSARGWTNWGYLPFVDYSGAEREGATLAPVIVRALGDRTLRKGLSGADVKALQEALIALGFDCGRWGADGDYGAATLAAVMAFQKAHGISDDGVFGAVSYRTLLEAQADTAEKPDEDGSPEQPDEGEEPTYILTITGGKRALEAIQTIHGGALIAATAVVTE